MSPDFDDHVNIVLRYGFTLIPCFVDDQFVIIEISKGIITYKLHDSISYIIWKAGETPNNYMSHVKYMLSLITELSEYLYKMEESINSYPSELVSKIKLN